MSDLSNNTKSADAIQAWLVSTLAVLLEVQPHEINVNEPLSHYGLNSVEAITVSGDAAFGIVERLSSGLSNSLVN